MRHLPLETPTYHLSPVDNWKIHSWATYAYFDSDGHLGKAPRYNAALSIHDQVSELAESRAAELIVARYFNLDYSIDNLNLKDKADVGERLEIRWTRYDVGQLIIYPSDRDSDVAILVTGRSGKGYKIAGWIPIEIGKRSRFKNETQDSWWIPQNHLKPIEILEGSPFENAIRSM